MCRVPNMYITESYDTLYLKLLAVAAVGQGSNPPILTNVVATHTMGAGVKGQEGEHDVSRSSGQCTVVTQ